jgi:hypothetical protein
MRSSTGPSTRLKITSIGCVVLILVLRAVFVVKMALLAPSASFGLWYFGSLAVCYGIPFGIWYIVARPELHRPPAFGLDVARSRYVVGVTPRRTMWGLFMIANGTMATAGIVQRVPNGDHIRLNPFPGIIPLDATAFGVSIVVALAFILLDRPKLTLDRDGMIVDNVFSRKRIAWNDIAPYSALLETGILSAGGIWWRSAASGRIGTTPVRPYGLHVDPVFLLHAVRVYVDRPERRSEIGTRAGLDRLQRERSDALAAAGLRPA